MRCPEVLLPTLAHHVGSIEEGDRLVAERLEGLPAENCAPAPAAGLHRIIRVLSRWSRAVAGSNVIFDAGLAGWHQQPQAELNVVTGCLFTLRVSQPILAAKTDIADARSM